MMRSSLVRLRTSKPRRALLRGLALAPLAALAAACSDAPNAPLAPSGQASRLALGAPIATPVVTVDTAISIDTTTTPVDTTHHVDTFFYTGAAATVTFGDGHHVQLGANSICDPYASGYGTTLWDQSCTPARWPIAFTVTSWRDADGRAHASFSPDVRFAPGSTEMLYLHDSAPAPGMKPTIKWCSSLLRGECVDESQTDSTLTTFVVAPGLVARRIKHFSGYTSCWGFGDGDGGEGY